MNTKDAKRLADSEFIEGLTPDRTALAKAVHFVLGELAVVSKRAEEQSYRLQACGYAAGMFWGMEVAEVPVKVRAMAEELKALKAQPSDCEREHQALEGQRAALLSEQEALLGQREAVERARLSTLDARGMQKHVDCAREERDEANFKAKKWNALLNSCGNAIDLPAGTDMEEVPALIDDWVNRGIEAIAILQVIIDYAYQEDSSSHCMRRSYEDVVKVLRGEE